MGAENNPTLHYFELQGKGEIIRYALAAAGVKWQEKAMDLANDYPFMKKHAGTEEWPFGQCPKYDDKYVTGLCQSCAILRHIARIHDIFYGESKPITVRYGSTLEENALIDMLMDGIYDLHGKYTALVYGTLKSVEAEPVTDPAAIASACEEFCSKYVREESVCTKNGGAHFQYLENMVLRFKKAGKGRNGFAVGDKVTIADTLLFFLTAVFMRPMWADHLNMEKEFPTLHAHYEHMKQKEILGDYIENSEFRFAAINGGSIG